MFPGFYFFFGGGVGRRGTFSLKLPRIRYQKTKIPIFEDFFKKKTRQKYVWFPINFITA